MKKGIGSILLMLLLVALVGCSNNKVAPQPKINDEDRGHLVVDKSDIKFAVTEQPKYLKDMIPASKDGYQVISLQVIITNHTQKTIHISPDYVTITTNENNTYKYAPSDLEVLGKSVFREIQVPPYDEKGGGILAFEIKNSEKVTKLNYKDDAGHDITVKFDNPDNPI